MKSPVLFLIFNRLDTVKSVIAAIRKAKPPRIYIASDGARPSRGVDEAANVQAVRSFVLNAIDWDCEVKTLFRSENLGCRMAVSGAIEWFFEHEAEGIILEDDCLPNASFFEFCDSMLSYYREDDRIMCISGTHYHGGGNQPEQSYFFSMYNHCWGWASWRRAWSAYDRHVDDWPRLREGQWLRRIGGSQLFAKKWTSIFDRAFAGQIDSWAYRWTYACWVESGLTVSSSKNLILNIGFNSDATHTTSSHPPSYLEGASLELLPMPIIHPSVVCQDYDADDWSRKNIFNITYFRIFLSFFRRFNAFNSIFLVLNRIRRRFLRRKTH